MAALGYWPLNGTGADLSVTANAAVPASPPNDPAYVASLAGKGQAMSFDGDDYAKAPSHASYNVTTFTVDFWFRANANDAILVAREAGGVCAIGGVELCQFEFWVDNTTSQLNVGIETPSASLGHGVSGGPNVVLSGWHHTALTVDDATKTMLLYVDGALVSTDTTWVSDSPEVGVMPITIGNSEPVGVDPLNGEVDELRFQAGVRTLSQVRSYYESGLTKRVQDYADTTNDWDTAAATTRMFGACLHDALDGATTDGTTWPENPGCPQSDDTVPGADWHAIVATSGTPGAKVATAPTGDIDAKAQLKFGLRIPNDQPAGLYTAPITVEVVAPAV